MTFNATSTPELTLSEGVHPYHRRIWSAIMYGLAAGRAAQPHPDRTSHRMDPQARDGLLAIGDPVVVVEGDRELVATFGTAPDRDFGIEKRV